MTYSLSRAIAEVVRGEARHRQMSDADVWRSAGMTKATFSRKMSGTTAKVSADDIEDLAQAFGWSAERLVRLARKYREDPVFRAEFHAESVGDRLPKSLRNVADDVIDDERES